ncbi:cell division protein ZapA [Paenibacillus wynnii]|uniref:cell division protein ZapA n=1 Tax=Paenibacillus wynnii TaxID=268407 RepID=UPI0027D7E480|nr:cell division protein ZapA [Paenibacillus wynnii]
MDRTRVAVEIYGTSYKLVGSSTEYMKQVARYVDEHMRTISKSHSRLDTPRIAVLAAVHMAEQALQVQDFKNELNMLTGERSELRVEVSRLLEVQRERQEEYERLEAAAKEEEGRLIAAAEEERKQCLLLQEQERAVNAELLQESEQAAAAARQKLEEALQERDQELKALRVSYEAEKAASRESHRQELAVAEAIRLQQLEELKSAHQQELENIRETLTKEKTETLSILEQELLITKESLGKELLETRTSLSKELADTKSSLSKELSEEREALQKEQTKNKELRQSQGTQEHRHKQQVVELEKQLGELRGGTGQLQSRLRAAEASHKSERDARLTLLAQYEAVINREEQLGVELRSATELGTQLNEELEELRQRYDLTQSEASSLRKSVQESGESLRRVQDELTRSAADVASWQELADKRMEDISELEMNLLEAEEKSSMLQKEIISLHGQADGLVQKLEQESQLRTEAEHEREALREHGALAQKELSALRVRYEELIAQYDEVLQDGERLQERYLLLETEGEEAALRLEELSEAAREAATAVTDQREALKEAEEYGLAWKHKYDELVERQRDWSDTEHKLREEINLWQLEVEEAEGQREILARERSEVLEQLGEVGDNYEMVQGQLRLLKVQFDQRQVELEQLTREHRSLQAEYAKLQVEYNEWIQLIEQDS